MIQPTVGRVVWFYSSQQPATPMAAIIAHVVDDHMVNLMVIEQDGNTKGRTSVMLLQGNDAPPSGAAFWCAWMPYQLGQAARTEAAEAKIAAQEGS